MNLKRIIWIIGATLLAMTVNVGITVIYMVIYGNFVNPGQSEAFYQEYVQTIAPYSSIIAGIPIFFVVSYFLARKWEVGFALLAGFSFWLFYAFLDLTILSLSGWTGLLAIQAAVSLSTKLAAALFGASFAKKKS